PEAQARIGEALAAGFAAIVPARAVALNGSPQTGWWQVDPATGRTLDRMEDGGGQEVAEEAEILDVVVEEISKFYHLTTCIVSIGVAVGAIIAAALGGGAQAAGIGIAGGVHGLAHCAAAAAH
ncbi:MAG TPA: hypothetical protein VFQ80_14505, partial [Thermomicrobiales bacterium]|nr:hypothetical protein [Thermomicrobiales bacterium]